MFTGGRARGNTRGGQDQFKWDDVKQDKYRENYLGHSVMAPVGRWQKNKDLAWFNKQKGSDIMAKEELQRRQEMAIVKQQEAEALAAMLQGKPVERVKAQLSKEEITDLLKRGAEADEQPMAGDRMKGVGFGIGGHDTMSANPEAVSTQGVLEGSSDLALSQSNDAPVVHSDDEARHDDKSRKRRKKDKKEKKEKSSKRHKKEKKERKKDRRQRDMKPGSASGTDSEWEEAPSNQPVKWDVNDSIHPSRLAHLGHKAIGGIHTHQRTALSGLPVREGDRNESRLDSERRRREYSNSPHSDERGRWGKEGRSYRSRSRSRDRKIEGRKYGDIDIDSRKRNRDGRSPVRHKREQGEEGGERERGRDRERNGRHRSPSGDLEKEVKKDKTNRVNGKRSDRKRSRSRSRDRQYSDGERERERDRKRRSPSGDHDNHNNEVKNVETNRLNDKRNDRARNRSRSRDRQYNDGEKDKEALRERDRKHRSSSGDHEKEVKKDENDRINVKRNDRERSRSRSRDRKYSDKERDRPDRYHH